jgi:hypothetical protein
MYRALLLLAIAGFGCSKGDEASKHVSPPDLQIVSAGNEPRATLHYHAPKGTKTQLEVALDVEVSAGEMGGQMPTIVLALQIEVEDVVRAGMKLRSTVVDATARDRDDTRVDTKALGGPLGLLKGVALTTTMAPAGRLSGTTIELGNKQLSGAEKSQLAALTTSFDQLMMTLPDEPVGVGAVWRNSKQLEQNGMKMIAVNTVTLTAIDGDKLTYTLDSTVHGADQKLEQQGLTVDIKDITGTGHGTGTIDLGTLKVTSETTSELRSAMQAVGEGSATPMKMSIATHVK